MNVLFLDDIKVRMLEFKTRTGFNVFYASNQIQFERKVRMMKYDLIMLDYNISNDYNGNDAAQFLVKNYLSLNVPQLIIIHSNDPYGAAEMANIMEPHMNLIVSIIPSAWQRVFVRKHKMYFEYDFNYILMN